MHTQSFVDNLHHHCPKTVYSFRGWRCWKCFLWHFCFRWEFWDSRLESTLKEMNYSWNQFRIISWFFIIFPLHFSLFCSVKLNFQLYFHNKICAFYSLNIDSRHLLWNVTNIRDKTRRTFGLSLVSHELRTESPFIWDYTLTSASPPHRHGDGTVGNRYLPRTFRWHTFTHSLFSRSLSCLRTRGRLKFCLSKVKPENMTRSGCQRSTGSKLNWTSRIFKVKTPNLRYI